MPDSLTCTLQALPTPLAEVRSVLESERWPGRGFEAAAARGLLDTLALRSIEDSGPADPAWIRVCKTGRQSASASLESCARPLPDTFLRNAYVTLALQTAEHKSLSTEAQHLLTQARAADDPYLLALAAVVARAGDRPQESQALAERLVRQQAEDGHIEARQSPDSGESPAPRFEATALAALAWLEHPGCAAAAGRAIDWLRKNRQGPEGFGSPYATALGADGPGAARQDRPTARRRRPTRRHSRQPASRPAGVRSRRGKGGDAAGPRPTTEAG